MAAPAEVEPEPADYLPAMSSVGESVSREIQVLSADWDLGVYLDLRRRVEPRCATYVFDALRSLGWSVAIGEHVSTSAVAERLGVVPQHHRLLGRLLEIAAEEGVLRRSTAGWEVVAALDSSMRPYDVHLSADGVAAEAELDLWIGAAPGSLTCSPADARRWSSCSRMETRPVSKRLITTRRLRT